MLSHHRDNLLLDSLQEPRILLEVWAYEDVAQKREPDLNWDEPHHEESDDVESSFDNQHNPMHQSEDPQRVHQIKNVQEDDDCVHLVLLCEIVCVVHHLDVLLFVMAFVVVVKDSLDVVVVRHEGHEELAAKADYYHHVGED